MEAHAILNVTEKLKDNIVDGLVTEWTSNADVPVGGYFKLYHGKENYAYLKVLTKVEDNPNIWKYTFIVERSAKEEALLIKRLQKLGYVE